jgi:hypothetical protein
VVAKIKPDTKPASGSAAARKAKARKKKAGGGRRPKKRQAPKKPRKQKKKHKCGDSGSYGQMKDNYKADGKERDHVPSGAALVHNAKNNIFKGTDLCKEQISAIKRAGAACAIPKPVHDGYSKTWTYRNNETDSKGKTLAERDGNNKKKAANRDTAAIKKGLREKKASKECKKKYAAWAEKVNGRTQKWYENMIKKAANAAK